MDSSSDFRCDVQLPVHSNHPVAISADQNAIGGGIVSESIVSHKDRTSKLKQIAASLASSRFILGLAAIAVIALILAFSPSHPPPPFRLGAKAWAACTPVYLARHDREWPETLISVAELTSDASIVRAMQSGALEAGCMTLEGAFRVQAAAIDVRIVAVLGFAPAAQSIVSTLPASIKNPSELRGKRVAVERSGLRILFLARVLKNAGLSLSDVVIVNSDLTEQLSHFNAGRVDAVVTNATYREQMLAKGGLLVCDSDMLPSTVIHVLVVRADAFWLNPGAVRDTVRGVIRSTEKITGDPTTRPLVARLMGLPAPNLEAGLRRIRIPSPFENRDMISTRENELVSTAKEMASELKELGVIDGPINPDELFLKPAEMDLLR